jgi:hypothetical protein
MSRDQRTRVKHLEASLSEKEVRNLLSILCERLGFCLAPDKQLQLSLSPPTDIDQFTRAVFVAEGLDPLTSSSDLYQQVRECVTRAFVKHSHDA